MIFGEEHTKNNTDFLEIQQMVTLLFRGMDPTDPIQFIPWIRHLYHTEGFKSLIAGTQQRDRFLKKKIEERSKILDPNNINGAIDVLLLQNKDKDSRVDKLPDDEILMILSDIILASSDTLVESLRWIILLMLHYPECQERIYQELSSSLTINGDGDIKYSDIASKHPYLQATLLECFRFASLIPTIVNRTVCDTSVDGKPVPKGAMVLFNLYFAHHDPRHWGDRAHEFDPTRWFDNDASSPGKLRSEKYASFLPFGAGTRGCLGEKAGRIIITIFAARLFAKYKMIPSPSASPESPDSILQDCKVGTLGLCRCVISPFDVVFEERCG